MTGSSKTPIFFSLLVSLIFGLPHLLIPLFLGGLNNYQPLTVNNVPLLTFEEAFTYGAQAREVCDGHPFSSDAHLFETKNLPSNFAPLPSLLAGGFGCLIGSIPWSFAIFDFILPPIIFLVIYVLFSRITHQVHLSILAGILVLTTEQMFLFLPPLSLGMLGALWEILTVSGKETAFLEFSRFPFPQLAFLVLLLHLFFSLRALQDKKFWQIVPASLFFGLLFYTYFYYWTFALANITFLLLIFLNQRKSTEAKILLLILSLALLIAIPYLIRFSQFHSWAGAKDVLERMGLEQGRFRNLYRTAQYFIFAFIFFKLLRKKDLVFWFFFSLIVGGIISLNIQILTGYTLQSWHWTTRVINPLVIMILVYLISQKLGEKSKFGKFATYSLIFIFVLRAFVLQFVSSKNSFEGYTLPKTTLESFTWLNQNTPPDTVIISPSFETNSLIPLFTHNNVFLPIGNVTIASNQQIIERFLITSKFFEINQNKLAENLSYRGNGLGDCKGDNCLVKFEFWEKQAIIELFYMKYLNKTEDHNSWSTTYEMPSREQFEILEKYDKLLTDNNYPINYKIDYLYYGPAEKKINPVDFKTRPRLKEVFQNKDISIFKIEN